MTRVLLSVGIMLPGSLPVDTAINIAAMTGRLGFAAVYLTEVPPQDQLERLVHAAAPAQVLVPPPSGATGVVWVNDPVAVATARAKMDAEGVERPLRVCVPISIGRTMSEAEARAALEPRFEGGRHPRHVGIFGTFEQAQDQVLALARAGADQLLLEVPLERDVADVLAQIRALVVGATPQLVDAPPANGRTAPPQTVFYSLPHSGS
ncbi:hypothetical protein ACIHFC_22555 [Streptomyces sp. NPDC052013]|uniref:hypothetical protein n=1 Tax=Streptomyces sp. NPDC052013 TaxID=3365679 RepID=UPI0037D1122C